MGGEGDDDDDDDDDDEDISAALEIDGLTAEDARKVDARDAGKAEFGDERIKVDVDSEATIDWITRGSGKLPDGVVKRVVARVGGVKGVDDAIEGKANV